MKHIRDLVIGAIVVLQVLVPVVRWLGADGEVLPRYAWHMFSASTQFEIVATYANGQTAVMTRDRWGLNRADIGTDAQLLEALCRVEGGRGAVTLVGQGLREVRCGG